MSLKKWTWPKFELGLDLLSGSFENGGELYLTGSFGGFGGSFHTVHKTLDDAKKFLIEGNYQSGSTIYQLKLKPITHIYKGKEYEP